MSGVKRLVNIGSGPHGLAMDEIDAQTNKQRIELGILPADLRARADAAVMEADAAQAALAAGMVTPENAIGVAMQARAEYDEIFLQAYKDAYIAEVVAENWKREMQINTNRRAAVLLLLH